MTDLFRPVQLDRLKATWTCLTAMTAQLLPLFGAVRTRAALGALVLLSGWLTVEAIRLLRSTDGRTSAREPFVRINLFALGLAVMLVLDSVSVASSRTVLRPQPACPGPGRLSNRIVPWCKTKPGSGPTS